MHHLHCNHVSRVFIILLTFKSLLCHSTVELYKLEAGVDVSLQEKID